MSEQIVRHDIVQLDFDIGGSLKEIQKLQNDINELKKKLTGSLDNGAFDELKNDANESVKPLQKVKEQAEKLKDKLTEIGKKAAVTAFNGLKKLASISFKALTVGLTTAATLIGGIVTKSVSAYAEFEQLKGGVETLFGAKGAKSVEEYAKIVGKSVNEVTKEYDKKLTAEKTVLKNANEAYKTAGLSANDYMQTVTSFSASLISSVGNDTQKAADYANTALINMSDNANKMGTDMGSLQYAYQGFAKQNYTMLDNLKLGYGGNKTEMQRLIKDAAKMTDVQKKLGVTVDANSMSFGNIVQAINVMQESMYINGTTAKEAEGTITGSLNAMKASWGNLLGAIGSGENLDQCMENMINSVEIFGKNVIPVVERALDGIGIVIEKLAPTIAERLPSLAEKLIPPLISAAWELTKGLIKALPNIIKSVAVAIVDIFGKQFPIIGKIGDFFKDNASKIAGTIKSIIPAVLALVGAFKLFRGVKGITSLFGSLKGGSGGESGGLIGAFKSLANAKPTVILKGMLNLAIILGGFTILAAAFTKIAPYIAKMGDLKSILEVATIITILGVVGYALSQFAGIVGKIKVSTVAKGLANMAIMLGGMSALFLVVGALSFLNFDYKKMLKIAGILGVLGIVGSACAVFAGIAGMIPIPVVLTGLANIALVLAGLTAVVVAFGALSKIEGFNEFISKGGETLANLFNVLGKIVGSAIGGLGEGLTNSLPKIGANLSLFAMSLKPMFTMFKGADMGGIGSFFKGLGAFLLQVAGEKVLNFFTGGTDFAKLGKDLNTFATNSKGFFTTVATFPEAGFTKAKMLFDCLAGLKSLPKEGGVVGWFSGTLNYENMVKGLKQLSSASVIAFFTAVSSLEQKGFDNATKLFDCLAGLKSLPKNGGVVGWFSGSVNYENIAAGLKALSSEGVKSFFTMAGSLNAKTFENVTKMFDCLANISELPKEGSWWDKVTGSETSTISNLATELSNFATKAKSFFDLISTAKTETLTALAEGITKISDSITNMQTVVTTSATAILTTFTGMLNSIVLAIDSVDLSTEGSQMINGLISGMNSKKQAAVGAARSIANAINAEYQKIQDIHSPSRVWEKFGAYQIQGNINGMESNLPKLKSTAQYAGEMSMPKYTPESSGTTNNRTSYNTFSPSFTLNMNGASATDSNKRKVQHWVKEAIEETFSSMSRTSPSLIEV